MECKGLEGEATEGGLWRYDHAIVHIAKEDVGPMCCFKSLELLLECLLPVDFVKCDGYVGENW